MAVDIGTGTIDVRIDRRSLQAEAAMAERTLARSRTMIAPEINDRRLVRNLRQSLLRAGGRRTWQPIERGGSQALQAVGRRGIRELQQIERRGLAVAARLRQAFAGVGLSQAGAAGGALVRGAQQPAPAGGGRQTAQSITRQSLTAAASNIGGIGAVTAQVLATGSVAAAVIAVAAVTAGALVSRYGRLRDVTGPPLARWGAILENIGFQQAGRRSAFRQFEADTDVVQQFGANTRLAAEGLARLARESNRSATQEQRARLQDRLDRGTVEFQGLNRRERRLAQGLSLAFEGQINAVTQGTAEQNILNQLLAGHFESARDYRRATRDQAFEARRGAILQRQQTESLRVAARLVLQPFTGIGIIDRLTILGDTLGQAMLGVAQRLQGWGIFLGAVAVATYGLVVAARRAEQFSAAQVGATNIAARRGVDIRQVTAAVRTGAAGGLSELQVYRTALNAIRTEAPQIFGDLENVLENLRTVAAATGVTFTEATDRFLLGIRKNEPELLDELGIVLRVQAAYENYARSINVAAGELLPYQQRLAIAAEANRQLEQQARELGGEAVRNTQQLTEAVDQMAAAWTNAVTAFGNNPAVRFIAGTAVNFVTNILRGIQARLDAASFFAAEETNIDQINVAEAARNRLLTERLTMLNKATQQGNLDVRQQRELIRLQREIAAQQTDIFGPGGAGPAAPQFDADNIRQAAANLTELNSAIRNLAAARSRTRIANIQAPLNAVLSAIEPFGFELSELPENLRLNAQQIQALTRSTEEAAEARQGLAALYNLEAEEINNLIAALERLIPVTREKTAADLAQLQIEESRSRVFRVQFPRGEAGDLLRSIEARGVFGGDRADTPTGRLVNAFQSTGFALLEGLSALTSEIRVLSDDLGEFRSVRTAQTGLPPRIFEDIIPGAESAANVVPLDAAALRQDAAAFRAQRIAALESDLELTAIDRFSLRAAEFGLTLDTMTANLSSFVEGITLEGQNLQQALANFLRNIARSVTQAASQRIGQNIFGGLFTNVTPDTPGGGGDGLSLQEVQEASQRQGAYARVDEFYEAVG